jgi:hypothetical protein
MQKKLDDQTLVANFEPVPSIVIREMLGKAMESPKLNWDIFTNDCENIIDKKESLLMSSQGDSPVENLDLGWSDTSRSVHEHMLSNSIVKMSRQYKLKYSFYIYIYSSCVRRWGRKTSTDSLSAIRLTSLVLYSAGMLGNKGLKPFVLGRVVGGQSLCSFVAVASISVTGLLRCHVKPKSGGQNGKSRLKQ